MKGRVPRTVYTCYSSVIIDCSFLENHVKSLTPWIRMTIYYIWKYPWLNKIWYSYPNKRTQRQNMIPFEAKSHRQGKTLASRRRKKMVTQRKDSHQSPNKDCGSVNTSFQGNPECQGHSWRQPRITKLPIDPIAKASGNARARGKAEHTGKFGEDSPSATISKS